jgi:heme/copper-type cytochrome/quinol oxidase subunit 2
MASKLFFSLHNITLGLAAVVFLVVSFLLMYSLVRFRRKSATNPKTDQSFRDSAVLETIWMLIPVGLLVILVVLTFQTLNRITLLDLLK